MDSAWIAVIATAVGGALGFGSAWIRDKKQWQRETERETQRWQRETERETQRWQRETERDMRNQRLAACMRLLAACRDLRYVARSRHQQSDPSVTQAQIDEWRTQASVAEYEVQVLCGAETVARAKRLLRSTLDYLGLARDEPNWEMFRDVARHAAGDFVDHLRIVFGDAD